MDTDGAGCLEVRLGDLVFALSSGLDLVSPLVAGHHLRVARIARAIALRVGYGPGQMRDLLLAGALHDCGALSLRERLEIMRPEVPSAAAHAEAGYRLLRGFPHFEGAAEIVRYHHCPWRQRRGDPSLGRPVPHASHLLHLADRASVLPYDRPGAKGSHGPDARALTSGSGSRFVPELVEAFTDAAARPGFWSDVGAAGDEDLRGDPALSVVILAEADFRVLARLFCQLVDFRSRFTATHTSGVATVAGFLAPLAGITGGAGRRVSIAAALHDLGKLAVPSETLEKERALSGGERASLRSHPLHGWRMLERIPGMEEINVWANYHHERPDGSGYPFHLREAQIPLESRIVSASDVFTALTEERPYRRGRSAREAVDIMRGMADGGGFDQDVVALIAHHREEIATVRRLAQEGASRRYLCFLEHAHGPVHGHAAA